MKTVKTVLDQVREREIDSDIDILESLVCAGILDENKLTLVKRAMYTNTSNMTLAEKKSLVALTENLISHVLYEKQDHLSKFDKKRPAGYPSEKDIPVVLILKRKAIRVYPDNQKIALYYTQALDKYISIPFGPKAEELGIHMNEETKKEMNKVQFDLNSENDRAHIAENNPRQSFRKNLQTIREEKETVDESWAKAAELAVKAGGAAVRGATAIARGAGEIIQKGAQKGGEILSKIKSKDVPKEGTTGSRIVRRVPPGSRIRDLKKTAARGGAIAAGLKALEDSDTDLSDIKQPSQSDHNFSQAGRAQPNIGSPLGRGSSMQTDTPVNSTTISQTKRLAQVQGFTKESTNFSIINDMVSNDLQETSLSFGDKSVSINNRTGKKILQIHESLNKTNKRKLEKMLNEDIGSFKKAINFVVKVR